MLAICREEFPNLEINNIAHLLKIGKENKEIKSKINLLNSYLAMTIANAVSIPPKWSASEAVFLRLKTLILIF